MQKYLLSVMEEKLDLVSISDFLKYIEKLLEDNRLEIIHENKQSELVYLFMFAL